MNIHGQKTKCIYVLRNNDYLAYLSKHVCLLLKKVQDVLWPVANSKVLTSKHNAHRFTFNHVSVQKNHSIKLSTASVAKLVSGKYLVLLKLQNYQKLIFRNAQFM